MSRPAPARQVAGSVGAVALGSMVANVCSYLVHLPASRWLQASGYGEFAVLLAVLLILAVPALAVQNVVARSVVRDGATATEVRALGWRLCGLTTAASACAVPVVMAVASTGLWATIATAVSAPALVLLSVEYGLLQGRQRFTALGIALAVAGVLRTVPTIVVLAMGGNIASALAAAAAGTVLSALALRLADRSTPPSESVRGVGVGGVTAVLRASQMQAVLMVFTSVDLLLARVVLTDHDAGVYALGAVAAKAAFWLPQSVGVVFFPRFARDGSSLRSAVGIVGAIGAVVVGGAAVAGPLVPSIVGDEYRPVSGLLWLFAACGTGWALLQVVMLAAIAGDRITIGWMCAALLVVEVAVAITLVSSVTGLVVTATAVAALAVVAAAVRERVQYRR